MSFNRVQFRNLVITTLKDVGLHSESAVNLILGTVAQESRFGTDLRQMGNGPARGIAQIEKATFEDLKKRYATLLEKHGLDDSQFEELEWDLRKSIIFARLKYFSDQHPLPAANDVHGLAAMWKRVYNTYLGKGTEQEFIANYRKYVTGLN